MKYFQTALTLTSAATAFFTPVSGQCDFQEADIVTELDLFDSKVANNTLHLPGGELRYSSKFSMMLCAAVTYVVFQRACDDFGSNFPRNCILFGY